MTSTFITSSIELSITVLFIGKSEATIKQNPFATCKWPQHIRMPTFSVKAHAEENDDKS